MDAIDSWNYIFFPNRYAVGLKVDKNANPTGIMIHFWGSHSTIEIPLESFESVQEMINELEICKYIVYPDRAKDYGIAHPWNLDEIKKNYSIPV